METSQLEKVAGDFLAGRKVGNIEQSELISACENLIQKTAGKSLEAALKIARTYYKLSDSYSAPMQLSAARLLARISHMSGRHKIALEAYSSARTMARKDAVARARIDRALIDVHMYLGNFDDSRRAYQRAVNTFKKLSLESDLAQTRVNYGNLLHRQDRHAEAEKLYYQAGLYFEKADNKLAMARCYYNRANTLVQLFDIGEAELLYDKAYKIYLKNDFDLDANDARYGIAWLLMLTGKFHLALRELDECERIYRAGGDPRGEALCILDRAETFLGLGLYQDAREAALAAEKAFTSLGLVYEKSKASFFKAQAALALSDKRTARNALKKAREGFLKEKNYGFLGAIHVLENDLSTKSSATRNAGNSSVRKYFSKAQLPYWEAVAEFSCMAESDTPEKNLARLNGNKAVHTVPHLFALWQILQGDYYYKNCDPKSARACWKSAADRLDLIRAQLPPLELRNAFNRKAPLPHSRLIELEAGENPEQASAWAERFKTAGLWAPLGKFGAGVAERSQVEEALRELAYRVAVLTHQHYGKSGERSLPSLGSSRVLNGLQKQIRDKLIFLEESNRNEIDSPDDIIQAYKRISRTVPIVQFHIGREDILAFTHYRSQININVFERGRQRLNDILRRWRYIMESELLSGTLARIPGAYSETELWSELGEWLWPPLNVPDGADRVLLIPEGDLSNIPWEALIVKEHSLAARHKFIMSPSLRHYNKARKIKVKSQKRCVFIGPSDEVLDAEAELQALLNLDGSDTAVYNPSRRSDWPQKGGMKLWHYAGHAVLRRDNPFYSYLHLDDGPLFAADFRMKNCRVELAVLAACRSGEMVAVPGEESTGLVRSLLEMGARNVIAGRWPISDKTTALWMSKFYDLFFKDGDLLNASAQASDYIKEKYPSAYHWAAFTVYGAGDLGGPYEPV